MGILNIKHKGLRELYLDGASGKLGARYHKNAQRILDHLESMSRLEDIEDVKDMHELKGERKGTYSMHVTGNYCITFKWDGHDVYDVDFEDYH